MRGSHTSNPKKLSMHQLDFEHKFQEKGDLNQYWYSRTTIETIAEELKSHGAKSVAFLSTPSLFFAVCNEISGCQLFDLDEDFEEPTDGRFSKFDYRAPEISLAHRHKFEIVVIDPPFISEEVIQAYIEVYKMLARGSESRLLFTTIYENHDIIERFLSTTVHAAPFLPCIPNLVYQYSIFANYEIPLSSGLARINPEVISPE